MIRYMGGSASRAIPPVPSYDPDGLPLEPGLIEVVTPESSAPGERHEALADHVGEIAVRAWPGYPDDPETETSGVGWILAVDWVPYQQPTFVTPAFPGYVSGHSTFSRAAAEVMTAFTGSAYFPGGLASHVPRGHCSIEDRPDDGRHAAMGDVLRRRRPGRRLAAVRGHPHHRRRFHRPPNRVGVRKEAWDLAEQYFAGTA